MSKQPLFPHIPGKREPLFPHVPRGQQPATKLPAPRYEFFPESIRRRLPPIGATGEQKDPIVQVKFFTPWTNWTWYGIEFDGKDIFFGWVVGLEKEFGSFSLSELQSLRGPLGLKVERDIYFEPKPISQVMREHGESLALLATTEKLYQRGADGYPIGSDKIMRDAWGLIPDPNQPFWSGKGFIKPVKIYGWQWSPDYHSWRAYVRFPDGTETWTSPLKQTGGSLELLASTEGDPIRKFCCRLCGECTPKELLEEGRFPDRIAWLRHHYKEKHPGMWGRIQVDLLPSTKKPFIKVGERVRFIGSSRGRYETWPKDAWLEKGVTGTVKEYHPEQPAVRVGGEYFEALPPYAVVRWDFGGDTVIDPDDEGKRWERIHNEKGGKMLPQVTIEGGELVPPQYRDLIRFINEPLPDYTLLTLPAVEVTERKIDAVLKQLKAGVEGIQDSHQFQLFLTTMSKFHDYSIGNQILIMLQQPNATHVAGFVTWKELGRWVKRGGKSISILAPRFPPRPTCPKCGTKVPRGARFCPKCGASVEEGEIGVEPAYFIVVSVFDISQTEGKPLPEFEVPVLTSEVNEELFAKVITLAKTQGLDVSFESRPHQDPSIKGQYLGKSIWVRPEEPRAQQLKSLLHEVAHYYSEGVFRIPRRDAETIAESAAYVVGAHFGFDSGVRSFPYVALWAQDKKVLEQNLDAIRKVATTILKETEKT